MESWMNETMRAYFKERVTYLRESRQRPAQADDIVKLDDMQQSIGCCGMFMFMEWWSIKEQPTFPPDELE
ncbi:unnamed protein product [Dibothriocephalus latus]|uniref:Uncharacterized protein n=1 Tax=Dibothriocephalus latus TaxID=60516 RepID=A0A3P7PKP6_DIBLA|nr:unnamed protein product [Dibothriocephalus latus]